MVIFFANFVYFSIALPYFHIVFIFHILRYFSTKLDNCMEFRMLFPAMLIDFLNSKVCLLGEWSISWTHVKSRNKLFLPGSQRN